MSETPGTLVYRYGARPPIAGGDRVDEQLFLAHRYKNDLRQVELDRRAASEEALRTHAPGLTDLEHAVAIAQAHLDEHLQSIRDRNSHARRRTQTPEQRAEVKRRRQVLADARRAHRAARQVAYAADGPVRAALDDASATANARVKELRAEYSRQRGLYWGTYLQCEEAAEDFRRGAPPRFQRYRGEGLIAVQIQHGMTMADALRGEDPRFRLVLQPPPSTAADAPRQPHSRRSQRRQYAHAWVRIGTEADRRTPVWAVLPVVLHRMPPEGSRIKWVFVTRSRVGTHEDWSLQLVCTVEDIRKADCASEGAVGVDLGWRLMPDGSLRVAYWVGSDGRQGELRLPAGGPQEQGVARWAHVEHLQSIRDGAFNVVRETFAQWLASRAEVPAWLRQVTAMLRQWRSQARLAAVLVGGHNRPGWREQRFAGDEDIYATLEAWRRQDRHLYDWQEAERTKARRWRLDLYRSFAAQLRRQYQTVAVEDANWRDLTRTPGAEESAPNALARWHQRIASPGELRQCLEATAAARTRVESAWTTRTCSQCSHINRQWDTMTDLVVTCSACSLTMDQDENAARNLLAAASGGAVGSTPAPARGPQGDEGGGDTAVALTGERPQSRAQSDPLAKGDATDHTAGS